MTSDSKLHLSFYSTMVGSKFGLPRRNVANGREETNMTSAEDATAAVGEILDQTTSVVAQKKSSM